MRESVVSQSAAGAGLSHCIALTLLRAAKPLTPALFIPNARCRLFSHPDPSGHGDGAHPTAGRVEDAEAIR